MYTEEERKIQQQEYKAKLEAGLIYQDFVCDVSYQFGLPIVQYSSRAYQLAVGESRGGVEIKYDRKRCITGNLWIEFGEKAVLRGGPYAESGILRPNHWLFVIGDYDIIYYIPSKHLQAIYENLRNGKKMDGVTLKQIDTSLGFLLRENFAERIAALILRPKASDKISKVVCDLNKLADHLHRMSKDVPGQLTLFDMGVPE